jgi:hypothetical protein
MSDASVKPKLLRTTASVGEVTKPVSPENKGQASSTEGDVDASKGQSNTKPKAVKIVRQRSGRSWPPASRRRGGSVAQHLAAPGGGPVTDALIGEAESAHGQTQA